MFEYETQVVGHVKCQLTLQQASAHRGFSWERTETQLLIMSCHNIQSSKIDFIKVISSSEQLLMVHCCPEMCWTKHSSLIVKKLHKHLNLLIPNVSGHWHAFIGLIWLLEDVWNIWESHFVSCVLKESTVKCTLTTLKLHMTQSFNRRNLPTRLVPKLLVHVHKWADELKEDGRRTRFAPGHLCPALWLAVAGPRLDN